MIITSPLGHGATAVSAVSAPRPDAVGNPPGGRNDQPSPPAAHIMANNYLLTVIQSPALGDKRNPPVVGIQHDHNRNKKGHSKRKNDIDKSTNRLVANFLARKPALAQRMHVNSSCINSPAGTESMCSGGL